MITENEIKSLISGHISASENYDKTELTSKRERALNYYRGEMPDTPAMDNRSKVVSHDVSDTIGWILPGVMRVFTASDSFGVYEPSEPGDEEFCDQATDYVNYVFWRECKGYQIIWDSAHDAMLMNNGIIKHYWDDSEDCEYSNHSGLSEMKLAQLLQSDGVEVLTHSEKQETQMVVDPETQQQVEQQIITHDVKIKKVRSTGRLKIKCIPPEDFLIDERAETTDEARFCAHRQELMRSDLVEMGYAKKTIDDLPAYNAHGNDLDEARTDEDLLLDDENTDKATEIVEVYECYVKADADGDGVAEMLRVMASGSGSNVTILDWEVWEDDVPFTDIVIDRIPHRWEGRSVADETMDIQQIKTVVLRQGLDNLYSVNNPQKEAEKGSVLNPDELTSPSFGGVLWRKTGTAPIHPHVTPYIADKAFNALEYMDSVVEKRTGVSRSTMALDPGALQNQTAEGVRESKDSSYSKIELIARNLAEMGYSRLFRALLKLLVKHQDKPRMIRLRDDWAEMDPRHWNASMDVTINTGLGTGSRDRDLSMLNNILQNQYMMAQKAVEMGFPNLSIEMLPLIRNTLAKLCESAGMKSPEQFFPEVGEEELQQLRQMAEQKQNQPDPRAEAEKAKVEGQQQMARAKLQNDAQNSQQKLSLDQQKMEAELQMKRDQLEAEMALKIEQLRAELELKREATAMGAIQSANTSAVRMGGNPG